MRAHQAALSLNPMISNLLGLWQYGYMLESLVVREIRVRYRRSVLGVFWTLLNPILMMIIFTIVFSTLFARTLDRFPVYFLSAFLSWQFFSQTTSQAMTSMLRSAGLYKRIYVPKYIFVLATVFAGLINYVIALIPLGLLVLVLHHPITLAILFVPIGIIVLTGFTIGISFIVATIAVFFNDLTQFYSVILQAVMYLTALFYPVSIVPKGYRVLIMLNPMYHCVQMIRAPIYNGQLPTPENMVGSVLSALVVLFVGVYFFRRSSDRFVYYV